MVVWWLLTVLHLQDNSEEVEHDSKWWDDDDSSSSLLILFIVNIVCMFIPVTLIASQNGANGVWALILVYWKMGHNLQHEPTEMHCIPHICR
jgi:hypothetical protein